MITIQEMFADIRQGEYAPIYTVLGTERYFIEQIQEELLKNALDEEAFDLNFSSFDMKETTINNAIFEGASLPFFGERKLIFVNNPYFLTGERVTIGPDHQLEELADYLQNPAEFSIMVFFAPYEKMDRRKKITKLMEKKTKVVDVSAPRPHEVNRYIKDLVKNKNYRFMDDAFQLFLERTDGELTNMMHELEKLFLYHKDTKTITKKSVDQLVPKTLEQNVFELNNLILNNQVDASMNVYHDLLIQKEEPIKIVALLISQFRILLQVKILQKQGYQQGDIAKMLKVHPYRIKLSLQNVRKYDQTILSEALNYLIDADFKMKTGQINQELQIELFIMRFTQQNKVQTVR